MDVYQRALADGTPNWTKGTANLDGFMERIADQARFHKGKGFTVNEQASERLPFALDRLRALLRHGNANVHSLQSVADRWTMKARTVSRPDPWKGDLVIANAEELKGTPYKFGVTDCSWLSEAIYKPETGDDWPHNAAAQHAMFGTRSGYVRIDRSQIRVGDLLFIDRDRHVATYAGKLPAFNNIECVWDTEPSDTSSPSGWPTPTLQTGVRVRPMIGNYYCSWQYVNGIGRVVEVNGQP